MHMYAHRHVSVSKSDLAPISIQTIPGSLYPVLALSPLEVIGPTTMSEPCHQAVQKWGHVETGKKGR